MMRESSHRDAVLPTTLLVFRDPPPPRKGMASLSRCYALMVERSGRWAVVHRCPTAKAVRNAKRRLAASLVELGLWREFELQADGCELLARVKGER